MTPVQDCLQCGQCCEKWGWDQKGISDDIVPWITARRTDILQHVSVTLADGRRINGRDVSLDDLPHVKRISYWVSPSGRALTSCPFYWKKDDGKVYCRIHDTKPAVCIGFAPWAELWHDYGLECPACRKPVP